MNSILALEKMMRTRLLFLLVLLCLRAYGQVSAAGATHIMVDQLPGADACAKIDACYGLLPASGGVCDATAIQGAQLCAVAPNCKANNAVVLLGDVALTIPGPWKTPANGCSIIGVNRPASWILTSSATADVLQAGAEHQVFERISVASAPGVKRTAGACINVSVNATSVWGPGIDVHIEDVTCFHTFHGVWMSGNGAGGMVHKLFCAGPNEVPNYVAGGNVLRLGSGTNDCYQSGPVSSGSVTGGNVIGLVAQDSFGDAAIVIDSGSDAQQFENLDIGGPSSGSMSSLHIKNTAGSGPGPTNITISNAVMESAGDGNTVEVDACTSCTISNSTLFSPGPHSLTIGSGVGAFRISDSSLSGRQDCVTIAAGPNTSGIQIFHNVLNDCGLGSNNAYDGIAIAADASHIQIVGNQFKQSPICAVWRCQNISANNIKIASGLGDDIAISGNQFGNNSGIAVINEAVGKNIVITANSGPGIGNSNTGPFPANWQCSGPLSDTSIILQNNGSCGVNNRRSFISFSSSGTLRNLQANCLTAGRSARSGTVEILDGGLPTNIQCTIGTVGKCSDTTNAFHYSIGDVIQLRLKGGPEETLSDCSFSLEKW